MFPYALRSSQRAFASCRQLLALFLIFLLGIILPGSPLFRNFYSGVVLADSTAQTLPFTQDWTNTGLITLNDNWSGVPGIEGYLGQDITIATGTDPQTLLSTSSVANDLTVLANQTATNISNGDVAEFHTTSQAGAPGTNPTIALQGSGAADAPYVLLYLNTTGQTSINVSYNLRDIDCTADNAQQQVALQYRVGSSGNFTNIPAGYVSDATTGPSLCTAVTAVNTTLPVAAENQSLVQVRIITTNAANNDEWVGVDDISITGTGAGNPTNPSGAGAATPSSVPAGSSTLLTVTVTPGTIPTSTGLTVTGDLSSIGGSATQQFFDNGTNGDVTPNNNVFSYNATVTAGTSPGAKSLPFTINDAQARNGTGNISLTVQAATGVCGDPFTPIYTIQGSAASSPLASTTVTTEGIVTGDFQGSTGLGGFYMQDPTGDANTDTSDGIFVVSNTAVSAGDRVRVTGTVADSSATPSFNQTVISPVTVLSVCSTGNPLPASVIISDLPTARTTGLGLERFEGMRVTFGQALVVTDNNDLGRFGELTVSSGSRLYIPTNSIDPNDNPASGASTSGNSNVAAVTAQRTANNNNRIIVDDGSSLTNNSTPGLTPIPYLPACPNPSDPSTQCGTIRAGDTLDSNATGIIGFGFSNYRLQPTSTLTFTSTNPRPAAPASVGTTNLRVVSFNVENYFLTFSGTSGDRGANSAAELVRQRDKLVAALVALNADVIGLVELQKANGNEAAADLAAALSTQGIGTYAAVADLATLNGTDTDIKNGIIYRTHDTSNNPVVAAVGSSFTDTAAPAGAYSRDPLAQTFQLSSNGGRFTIVVNHFRSKICPGTGGDADVNDGQSCFNDRRRSQAMLVAAFVTSITSSTGDSDVLVVGDLNAYAQEDPVDVFRAAGLVEQIERFVAQPDRYTFNFGAEVGQLDHAFATASLNTQATGATIWHINADEPAIIDYDTNDSVDNSRKPDDRYEPTPYRSADHDPLLIGFNLSAGPPSGQLQFSSASYTVAENGGTATIIVTRTGGSAGQISATFNTSNGTATAGADYTAVNNFTVTFGDADTASKTITIPINNDSTNEPDETVNLTLSNPVGGGLGAPSIAVLTITNDDTPTVSLSAASYTISEDGLRATIVVNRQGDLSQSARVDYLTSDPSGLNNCNQVTGNASSRCDYVTTAGTLRFAAGETTKNINIPIINDVYLDGTEVFTLTLSNPIGGQFGSFSTATITITDNDTAPAPNPIDNDEFFIRQLYIDFLGREPEPPGLAAWLAILNRCAVPTDCDRIAVARGFVRSPEFQDRGYFIYRAFRASLGRFARYEEFIPDMARLSGFLSAQDLEANKVAYIEEFMNRQEFSNIYHPTFNNPMAYVDTLLQRADLPNHPRRAEWIAGLTNNTLTRAQVLRQLIESAELYGKYVNEAFIVMNYFGFLRRDPDAAYLVWLNTFNQTMDDRVIINGFVNSLEYRLRFGPN